jgi:uncharacterized protein DUF5681
MTDMHPSEPRRSIIDSPRGRSFAKGQSGNPAGRPLGSRNRTTRAAEALLDGEAEALTRKAIELARNGDLTALRICLDRILPPRRERRLNFELPKLNSAEDAVKASAAIVAMVAAGEITLSEAEAMGRLVDHFIRALEAHDIDQRLRALETERSLLLEARDYDKVAASYRKIGDIPLSESEGGEND